MNPIEFHVRGQKVPEYPVISSEKLYKCPYILMDIFMSKNSKFTLYALADSGCSINIIAKSFVDTFPEHVKSRIEPFEGIIATANPNSQSKVVGRIKLLVAFKSQAGDRFPLFTPITFEIAANISKKVYLGTPFLFNENIVGAIDHEALYLHYPENYPFSIDTSYDEQHKQIHFYFLDALQSMADNEISFTIAPFETMTVNCNVSRNLRGRTVLLKNFENHQIFASDKLFPDNFPMVFESRTIVTEDNKVTVTLLNMDSNYISIDANSPIAKVITQNLEEETTENFTQDFPEVSEIETCMKFYTAPLTKSEDYRTCDNITDPFIFKANEKLSTLHSEKILPITHQEDNSLQDYNHSDNEHFNKRKAVKPIISEILNNSKLNSVTEAKQNFEKPVENKTSVPKLVQYSNEIDKRINFIETREQAKVIKQSMRKLQKLQTNKLMFPEINWMSFLEDDPVADKMTRYIDQPLPLPEKKKKEDFSEEEFLAMFNFDTLGDDSRDFVKSVALKFRDAFAHHSWDVSTCSTYTHDIEVVKQPTLPKQRHIPDKIVHLVEEQVEALIEAGVMERGTPLRHYSNFVPILKKDGSLRLCCDLILLNLCIKTLEKVVHMGCPDSILHRLFKMAYCWSVDLKHAFWSIPVTKRTKLYYGMYSYRTFQDYIGFVKLIMGEKSAIQSFNRMVNQIFGNFHSFLVTWVDDFLIYSSSLSDLHKHFEEIVKTVYENGLSLSPQKMDFHKTTVLFLGKLIHKDKQCVQIPEAKLQGLLSIKPPVCYKSLKSFLGSLQYYNAFFKNIGIAAYPLYELLRQQTKVPFKWTTALQEAFLNVKKCIGESMLLYFPYENGIYEVYTDASKYTYSMCLYSTPRDGKGETRLVAMHSAAFRANQLNWSIYYKELYAVCWCMTNWIQYLYSEEIIIHTDCKSLIYASESKADHSIVYRLAILLASLNLTFKHVKGENNRADHSSRTYQSMIDRGMGIRKIPKRTPEEIAEIVEATPLKKVYKPKEVQTLLTHNFRVPVDQQKLETVQKEYEEFLSNIPHKKPFLDAKCCTKHKMEISTIELVADYFSMTDMNNSDKQNAETRLNCESCLQLQTDFIRSNNSAFSVHSQETDFDKRRRKGNELVEFIFQASEMTLFHHNDSFGYSILSTDKEPYAVNSISQIEAFTMNKLPFLYEHSSIETFPNSVLKRGSIGISKNMEKLDIFNMKIYYPHNFHNSQMTNFCANSCQNIYHLKQRNEVSDMDAQKLHSYKISKDTEDSLKMTFTPLLDYDPQDSSDNIINSDSTLSERQQGFSFDIC